MPHSRVGTTGVPCARCRPGLAAGAAPATRGGPAGRRIPLPKRSPAPAPWPTLDFTTAEHELMRAAVARNRRRYRQLRAGRHRPRGRARVPLRPIARRRPAPGPRHAARDAAVRARATDGPDAVRRGRAGVRSGDRPGHAARAAGGSPRPRSRRCTLARLARYADRLRCVVTLTPDLARAQAAEADREMAAGRYRGPLHGVPWGAKDLLATAGVRTTWGAPALRRPGVRP